MFRRVVASAFRAATAVRSAHAAPLRQQSSWTGASAAEAYNKYIVPTYVRPNLAFVRGKGVYVYDTEGKEYLDFSSGIAVNALGHSDPDWAAAVAEQARTLCHVSNLFHSIPSLELAKSLVELSFADKVFFSNSGTEANEGAIKFCRKWGLTKDPSGAKHVIVSFSSGFHGRTMGALAATHNPTYQNPFAPHVPGIVQATYNDLSALDVVGKNVCGVFVEPIQGEGGINPAKKEFLQKLRAKCTENGAILVFDEVQCGLGRTGYLWAHEHPSFNVKPDVMTLAKPLAGGLPIGAILMTQAVSDVMKAGEHGSTFSGGPLVCRAAQVVLGKISHPAFLQKVRDSGEYLRDRLVDLQKRRPDHIKEVRGFGLMVGVELFPGVAAADVTAPCFDRGVIVITSGKQVLRLLPPLIVERAHIDAAVKVIGESLDAAVEKKKKESSN